MAVKPKLIELSKNLDTLIVIFSNQKGLKNDILNKKLIIFKIF